MKKVKIKKNCRIYVVMHNIHDDSPKLSYCKSSRNNFEPR